MEALTWLGVSQEMVAEFLSRAPNLIAALRATRRNPQAAEQVAHRLRGNSGLLGARALAAVCAEIEARGREGYAIEADALDRLDREYATLRAVLQAEFGG